MAKIVCSFRRFQMGGVETYFIRMFKWGIKNGYEPVLLLPEGEEYDSVWEKEIKELRVAVVFYTPLYKTAEKDSRIFRKEDSWIFISATRDTYYACLSLISDYGLHHSKIYFYVLHPKDTTGANQKLKKLLIKYLLIKPLWDRGLVFMDEETEYYCRKTYLLKRMKPANIVRLGQIFDEYDPEIVLSRSEKDDFTILSICRFDFPFKGYVLGLIKDFERLCFIYDNLQLVLVGDGAGKIEIEEICDNFSEEIRKKIFLTGQISYDRIRDLIHKADLYIGMGTTLIDAAMTGLVGITAIGDQRDHYALGFFHNNIREIGILLEDTDIRKTFYDLIEDYLGYSNEEKIRLSEETYKLSYDEYEINRCMEKLLRLSGSPALSVKAGLWIRRLYLNILYMNNREKSYDLIV